MIKFFKNHWPKQKKGFTIAELLISTVIFGLIITFSAGVYSSFFSSVRNLKAANNIYEETRFTMERIVAEVRSGTIDYEEYFNQKGANIPGKNYCSYNQKFYLNGPDGVPGTVDDESIGIQKDGETALDTPLQEELYIINAEGDGRTLIKLENDRVKILKLDGKDYGIDGLPQDAGIPRDPDQGEGDGLIDTWVCASGFTCAVDGDGTDRVENSSYVDITPASIEVKDIQFIIEPLQDPRKAYNEPSIQIQPHVTIKLTAQSAANLAAEFQGDPPSIVLESTVTTRVQQEILTGCNTAICLNGNERACGLQAGVCLDDTPGAACLSNSECTNPGEYCVQGFCREAPTETCNQGSWGGCDATGYAAFADANNPAHPSGLSNYQAGSEIAGCTDDACREAFCEDGLDNDCDGFSDLLDSDCTFYFCSNGQVDTTVANLNECAPDVGGACAGIHTSQPLGEETLCFDGYDNDCSGDADEFDSNCIDLICSNGVQDPTTGNTFAANSHTPTNYTIGATPSTDKNELAIDVGGLCGGVPGNEIGAACFDGLDNDNDGAADELDPDDCKPEICENNRHDTDMVSSLYTPQDYLGDYTDSFNTDNTDLDEACQNIGGVCSGYNDGFAVHDLLTGESDVALPTWQNLCSDGLDNDCDGDIDTIDTECCIDQDGDGYGIIGFIDSCSVPVADCNDSSILASPGILTETSCTDSLDNDCDGDTDFNDSDCIQIAVPDLFNGVVMGVQTTLNLTQNDDVSAVPSSLVISVPASDGGTIINNGDGTVDYTSSLSPGTVTFEYEIDDTSAITHSASVEVNVVQIPFANDQNFEMTSNDATLGAAISGAGHSLQTFTETIDLKLGDSYGPGIDTSSYVVLSGPSNGSLDTTTPANGVVVYTPGEFTGQDSFTYRYKGTDATDSNIGTVTIDAQLPMVAFISPNRYDGDFGGTAGGNALCQTIAYDVGSIIPAGKTFKAWLGSATDPIPSKFFQSPGKYVTMRGTIVADNWADLTNGNIDVALNITPAADNLGGQFGTDATRRVWTGAQTSGGVDTYNCNDWISTGSSGTYGIQWSDVAPWTDRNAGGQSCSQQYKIYCLQTTP